MAKYWRMKGRDKRHPGAGWRAIREQLRKKLKEDKSIAWKALIVPDDEWAFQHPKTRMVFQEELDEILKAAKDGGVDGNIVAALETALERAGRHRTGGEAADACSSASMLNEDQTERGKDGEWDESSGYAVQGIETVEEEVIGRDEDGSAAVSHPPGQVEREVAGFDRGRSFAGRESGFAIRGQGVPEARQHFTGGQQSVQEDVGKGQLIAHRGFGFTAKLGIAAAIVLLAFGVGSRTLWTPESSVPSPEEAEMEVASPLDAETPGSGDPSGAPDREVAQTAVPARPASEPPRASGSEAVRTTTRDTGPRRLRPEPAREVALSSGDVVVDVVAGGGVAADSIADGCVGYVRVAPDLRVNWGGPSTDLSVRFVRDQGSAANLDPTLVVGAQDGSWVCGDDSEDSTDPMVVLRDSRQGEYDVWVGSWDPDVPIPGNLHIGEDAGSAFTSLLREAEAGSAAAQTEVGLAYAAGVGVEPDRGEALGWLDRATEQGHEEAFVHLAMIHLAGEGVPQDGERALQWLRSHPQVQNGGTAANNLDEARIASDFRELESELASSYSEMTRRYLDHWRAVDWDTERPRMAFMGDRSVDDELVRSNESARDRLIEAGDRLRSDLLRTDASVPPSLQRQLATVVQAQRERGVEVSDDVVASLVGRLGPGAGDGLSPSIERAHRDYREKVEDHYDQLRSLIGAVAGRVCSLLIDVNPPDAAVYINDVPWGTAGEFANEPGRLVPSGTFRVRLERTGYSTHEEDVSARPYERHFIRGDLTRGDVK